MDPIFTIIIGILMALAVSGLVVGVANDAVNFINSALGSKAAPYWVIMLVASVGIMIGALTSSGMMEVARSGVFYPAEFTFSEIMMLFLGVMFANVILLDLFNSFGLPTSTTVSLVFGLLGSAIAVASFKIWSSDTLHGSDMSMFINAGKAMVIISGILMSVAIAFVVGSVVMYITRVIFTFRYTKVFDRVGYFWCGIAFTAITYFALFKGLKSSGFINEELLMYMTNHLGTSLLVIWLGCSALMAVLQHVFKVNILKVTILAGTFALALAFAGNDLVNFIGVPIAGWDSYKIAQAGGGADMMMGDLMKPVTANFGFLVAAGLIMVLTLWTSKKAKKVSETEINLAKQDEGVERFGSTILSRSLVRWALSINKSYERIMPESFQRFVGKRFLPLRPESTEGKAPFDMIRATVNLTVASILISIATSFKLPLSTTYVTFMVAMGSSLADRAWGRESAVYRITGVLTVISGWFVTALVAFVIAFGITIALMYGGTIAIIAITALCAYMLVQSSIIHRKKESKTEKPKSRLRNNGESEGEDIIHSCISEVTETMQNVTQIYKDTLLGVFNEDRKILRKAVKDSNELFYQARENKYEIMPTLQKLHTNYIDTGHYYVQVVNYLSEVTKALVHITRPSFEHINNNHEGLTKEQVDDLMYINNEVSNIYERINVMLSSNDFADLEQVLRMRDKLFVDIDEAIKRQLKRIKAKASSTKASMLYLNILSETKTMILQSRNLLKSQKFFVEYRDNQI